MVNSWPDWSWIQNFMNTSVYLIPYTGLKGGVPQYGEEVELKSFIMPKTSRVQTETGEWYESHTAIYVRELPSEVEISEKSRMRITYGGTYVIRSLRPYVNPNGALEMLEIYL